MFLPGRALRHLRFNFMQMNFFTSKVGYKLTFLSDDSKSQSYRNAPQRREEWGILIGAQQESINAGPVVLAGRKEGWKHPQTYVTGRQNQAGGRRRAPKSLQYDPHEGHLLFGHPHSVLISPSNCSHQGCANLTAVPNQGKTKPWRSYTWNIPYCEDKARDTFLQICMAEPYSFQ